MDSYKVVVAHSRRAFELMCEEINTPPASIQYVKYGDWSSLRGYYIEDIYGVYPLLLESIGLHRKPASASTGDNGSEA